MLLRSPERWAVAVRRPDGSIHTEAHAIDERAMRLRRGLARGLVALSDAISLGVRGLQIAFRETANVDVTARQIRTTLAAAGVGALVLLVVMPGIVAAAWPDRGADVLEGTLRGLVLVVYLLVVARSEAASRLFAYHGAEHKVVAAVERANGMPDSAIARASSPIHPRCGTNFVALFVLAAGVTNAFVPRDPLWAGAVWRVLLVPVDAVVAFEVMRAAAGESRAAWARLVTWPGRALQRITTREPTDDQLEVAFAALEALTADR